MAYLFLDEASVSSVTIWTRNACVHLYTATLRTISSSTWQMCRSLECWVVYSEILESCCRREVDVFFFLSFRLRAVSLCICTYHSLILAIFFHKEQPSRHYHRFHLDQYAFDDFQLGDTQKIDNID
jgi:hypothetical protein